jgi:hypothetical protein
MPWWFLAYVQTAKKPATVACVVGPFRVKVDSVAVRSQWLAIDTTHKATNPWYADPTGQDGP